MPKITKLDDDAIIYHPQPKQTEREKLQNMSFKAKIDYLWEYYKLHALAVIAIIAITIYVVNLFLHPKAEPQFYAAMINNTIREDILEKHSADFSKHLQLNSKKELIEFNTSFDFSSAASYSANMKQALVANISAKEVDVIIAPESQFYQYAYYGYFHKLSDQLPTDIYSTLTDQFYMTDTDADTKKSVYGLYLTNTDLYKNNADNTEPYVLGILANFPHEKNTIEFIKYLFHIE